ncbi:cohesin domain-containing protein [Desulfonema magnum]|uniref:Cohesin domain-containing protein n=1 Tax=Desulfonema magnum TaxID=45655 RepID=A0A975BK72_9BACT|nr:cohesin domain-containing protein [Desulfonema magnum]QTA86945.1 Cohesin domain-containing protein [Desulfonema magnum]
MKLGANHESQITNYKLQITNYKIIKENIMLWNRLISIIFCVLVFGATTSPVWAGQNASAGCALDMNIETRDYDAGISSKDIESAIMAEPGDEIRVAVVVQNVSNLTSYQAVVNFDPARLSFIEGYDDDPSVGINNF